MSSGCQISGETCDRWQLTGDIKHVTCDIIFVSGVFVDLVTLECILVVRCQVTGGRCQVASDR